MKMKYYSVSHSGGTTFTTVIASCITKAANNFIATLEKPATYKLDSREYASITYTDNYTIMSDFVIQEVH